MTTERKQDLLKKAWKVLPKREYEEYRNFINNYEARSMANHERITARYGRSL